MTVVQRQYYTPQPADARDFKPKAGFLRPLLNWLKPLPFKVELPYVGDVEDQGQTNSCVGHAVSGALEMLGKGSEQWSRLSIYYWARWYSKTTDEDSGCYIRDALKGVNRFRVNYESAWPFVFKRMFTEPTLYVNGEHMHIVFNALATEQDIKQALATGKPVVLAFRVPEQMGSGTGSGYILHTPEAMTDNYHAVLVYGYNLRGLMIKNSYGKNWGWRGLGVLDWAFVRNGDVVDAMSVALVG